MKCTIHNKVTRTNDQYWVALCEKGTEQDWCIDQGMRPSNYDNPYGLKFYTREMSLLKEAQVLFSTVTEHKDAGGEGKDMVEETWNSDYTAEAVEAMNAEELRKAASEAAGRLGKPRTTARNSLSADQKKDLVLHGVWPEGLDGVPAVADKADKAALLLELLGQLTPEAAPIDEEQIKEWINEAVGIASRKITIVMPETGTEKDMGIQHKDFDKILTLVKLTQPKTKKGLSNNLGLDGVCLWGGAGGGKTFLAHAIADALELDFYPCSCHPHMTASQLFGYPTATGGYVESPLYKAFKNGGLFLLDEGDRAPEGIITSLNGATANGFCTFPNGEIVEKHDNFCLLLGSNTNLRGNSKTYNSAKKQDGSVLDRYTFFELRYDEELEKMLSGGNADWYATVKKYRDAAPKVGSDHLITPRATRSGATLLATGIFTWAEVEEMTIWKGLDPDQVRKIKAAC